jgi:hypothetical protein
MSSRPQINVGVVGHDGVTPVFKKVSKEAHGLRGMLKLAFATGPLAGGMEGLIHSVVHFGEESVNKFEEVGKEILKLRRITGGTAEETSKMRFAFEETGLTVDDAARSLKKFATAAISKNGLSEIGVNAKDAHKQLKPMNQLLLETADKFAKMPNGVRKTAEATKLFGRAGLQLLPFLNKGSEGLQEFFNEADKFGLVFTEKDLKTTQAQVMAQREWTAAIAGFQVQLGRYILPYMTKWLRILVDFAKRHLPDFQKALKYVAGVFRKDILPVIKDLAKFLIDNKDNIVLFAKVMIPLIVAWKVYTTAILAFNAAMKIATGLQLGFNAAQKLMGTNVAPTVPGVPTPVPAGGGTPFLATGVGQLAATLTGFFAVLQAQFAVQNDTLESHQRGQASMFETILMPWKWAGAIADIIRGHQIAFNNTTDNPMTAKYGSLPPVTVSTTINLDGKTIANSTQAYMYRDIRAHGKSRIFP